MNSNTLIALGSFATTLYLGNKAIGSHSAENLLSASHTSQESPETMAQINAMASGAGTAAIGYGIATLGTLGLGMYFLWKR